MGDDKKQQDQHKGDLEHVAQQVGVVDATNAVSEMLNNTFLGGGIRFFGTTDFEGHRLNDMIDLVESANPDHLESAGKALWDARDAINDAAEELSGHIGRVDWEGDAGNAFRDWGDNLVLHTLGLADFAEAAGNQITAAGTGLASVRKSMPPRDNRADPKTVADIPAHKRVDSNDEYAAAVKAESHRQEAINQMNRLSSFYSVSGEALAAQPVPAFEPMPAVGVPKPDPSMGRGVQRDPQREDATLASAGEPGKASHHSVDVVTGDSRSDVTVSPHRDIDGSITYPDRKVGTEIDSVGTLPPQNPSSVHGTPSSAPGPTGAGGGMASPFAGGTVNPAITGPAGRTSGFGGGARTPVSAQGRVGTPGGASGARTGRGPMDPMGRATATGQAGTRGTATTPGKSPMGRGVSGGTPRPGGTAGGRASGAGATGAGRGNGVVGGKPTTGAMPGKTASGVPRGTVVGGEGAVGSRSTAGRVGQRGVIGAPTPTTGNGASGTTRRATSNPDGVVGTPKDRVSPGRGGGFSAGGTGLVRGPVGNRQASDRDDSAGAHRPDHVDEEETRMSGKQRRDVPPASD